MAATCPPPCRPPICRRGCPPSPVVSLACCPTRSQSVAALHGVLNLERGAGGFAACADAVGVPRCLACPTHQTHHHVFRSKARRNYLFGQYAVLYLTSQMIIRLEPAREVGTPNGTECATPRRLTHPLVQRITYISMTPCVDACITTFNTYVYMVVLCG